MDEETDIINSNTRNEKIRNFFINNRKILISIFIFILTVLVSYFIFVEYKDASGKFIAFDFKICLSIV